MTIQARYFKIGLGGIHEPGSRRRLKSYLFDIACYWRDADTFSVTDALNIREGVILSALLWSQLKILVGFTPIAMFGFAR